MIAIKTIVFAILQISSAIAFQGSNVMQSLAKPTAATETTAPIMISIANVHGHLCDPTAQGLLCGDVANVLSDLAVSARQSSIYSSTLNVCGRALPFGMNFLPNNHSRMQPEMVVCQSMLLLLAVDGLAKSVHSETKASSVPVTFRDGKAFKAFCGPAGLSWSQFKSVSSTAVDWVTCEDKEVICDDDDSGFLYWLYSGEVEIQSPSSTYQVSREGSVPRRHESELPCKMGLWGDLKFKKAFRPRETSSVPKSKLVGGQGGATLMRVHAPTLIHMMNENSDLAESVESLIFYSVRNKAMSL